MDSIRDAQGFSVETLTGVTLSWKTELNRSIPAMEDRIPRLSELQGVDLVLFLFSSYFLL